MFFLVGICQVVAASEFASEGFHEREGFAEKPIPARDLSEAGFFEWGAGRGGVDGGFERAETGGTVFEMGIDAVAEVAAGELAQAGLCGEMLFADAREIDLVDRP